MCEFTAASFYINLHPSFNDIVYYYILLDEATDHEINWKRFFLGGFERTVVGYGSDGEELVIYRNKKASVEIVGFDFGVG